MPHGGSRIGSGRPPGARNRRTEELEAATKEAAATIAAVLGDGTFEGDAHAFLMAIYKDPEQPMPLRLEAAKAAIRYEKPALAAIDVTNSEEKVVYRVSAEPLSDEEWERKHCFPAPDREH